MLRKNTITATRPLLSNLIRRGVGLESIEGTPIGELTTITEPGVNEELVEIIKDAAEPTPVDVLTAVEQTVSSSTQHALVIDGLVEQGSAQVGRVIDKAYNVVGPAIARTTDAVIKRVDATLTPPNVPKVFTLDRFATSTTVSNLLASFKGAAPNLVEIPDLPFITGEQYTSLLETGSSETNELLLQYLAQFPESYLNNVVADLVRGTPLGDDALDGYAPLSVWVNGRRYVRRTLYALGALAVACVILRNLYDNPFPNTPTTIDLWNEQVASALAGLGGTYHILLSAIADHAASRRLRLPTTLREGEPVGDIEFPILDRTYDLFLEKEGYPELLFGLTLRGSYDSATIDSALAEGEALNLEWGKYCEQYRARAMSSLSSTIRDTVYSEVGHALGELDLAELGVEPDTLWEAIKEYAESVTWTPDMMYIHVRFLYAKVLYAKYQTFDIISSIDEHLARKDASPRVAAYHAAREYVCKWVYTQMVEN